MLSLNIYSVKTPAYVVDEAKLIKNLEILKEISELSGAKILLAQKAFSMFATYPLIAEYLHGATASGIYEATLGYEKMQKENHIFSPAYKEEEFDEILNICDHIVFNSFFQWEKFREKALKSGKSFGIRINPEHSTGEVSIYDPCAFGSRLGVTRENFDENKLDGIDGLHMHTLCEQNSDALKETLAVAEEKFGEFFHKMKWINLGGGHMITKDDYDRDTLINEVKRLRETYNVEVYLEPGWAVGYNAGYLVTSILDIVQNGIDIAILDTSAACHMPDVLEMPYRPPLVGSFPSGEGKYSYRLAGPTCLSGDVIGDYSFYVPLAVGDKLVFGDMAIYSMVKNNTFNGMPLPSIALLKKNGKLKIIKKFSYKDFKNRLS